MRRVEGARKERARGRHVLDREPPPVRPEVGSREELLARLAADVPGGGRELGRDPGGAQDEPEPEAVRDAPVPPARLGSDPLGQDHLARPHDVRGRPDDGREDAVVSAVLLQRRDAGGQAEANRAGAGLAEEPPEGRVDVPVRAVRQRGGGPGARLRREVDRGLRGAELVRGQPEESLRQLLAVGELAPREEVGAARGRPEDVLESRAGPGAGEVDLHVRLAQGADGPRPVFEEHVDRLVEVGVEVTPGAQALEVGGGVGGGHPGVTHLSSPLL